MTIRLSVLYLAAACVLAFFEQGCDKPTRLPAAKKPATVTASKGSATVTKVVFVGKAKACDCSRTRIDLGWATVKKVLGDRPDLSLERLATDSNPIQVGGLREKKPMVTLPAVYFLDAKGNVLHLLQGEQKAEKIKAALASS